MHGEGGGPEVRLQLRSPRGPTTQSRGGVSEALEGGASRDSRRRPQPPRKPPGGSGRSGRSRAAPTAQAPHPGEARRAEVALVWLEPRGEFVRRGEGVMSSRLGAVPAVSFPVWPLCFRGSAVEPAARGPRFCPRLAAALIRARGRPHPCRSDVPVPPLSRHFSAASSCPPWIPFVATLPFVSILSNITRCLPYPLSSLFSSL